MSNSTCLRADLENSNIGSVNKSQAPSKKKPGRGLNEVAYSQPKCKPNCLPGGTLSKTRLASCSGGILAGSTGKYWRAAPARYWPDTRQDPPARDTQRDTWRDPLASYSGILSGMLGGMHWRAAGGILGRIHWRAALAGYWVGRGVEALQTCTNPLSGGEKHTSSFFRRARYAKCFSKVRQGTPSFAKFRQVTPSFAKLRRVSPSYAEFRQVSPSYAEFRRVLPSCAEFRQASPSFTKFRQVTFKFAKFVRVTPSFAKGARPDEPPDQSEVDTKHWGAVASSSL